MPTSRLFLLAGAVVFATTLAGCSAMHSLGEKIGVSEPTSGPAAAEVKLQVPPDLSSSSINDTMSIPGESGTATLSGYEKSSAFLKNPPGVAIHKGAGQRWLVVSAPPRKVWDWLKAYIKSSGLQVEVDSRVLGVLQTNWILRPVDLSRGIFGPAVKNPKDAAVADQYHFRLEPGEKSGTTEVFMVLRRLVRQKLPNGKLGEWELTSGDPFLEAEMLRGLMVYLGDKHVASIRQVAAAEAAKPISRLARGKDNRPELIVSQGFFDAWRETGLALDRLGFTVEDRDRSLGQYYVRYDPQADQRKASKGFLSSLMFWRKAAVVAPGQYIVNVVSDGDKRTKVTVSDTEGKPAKAKVADRILGLLHGQLH